MKMIAHSVGPEARRTRSAKIKKVFKSFSLYGIRVCVIEMTLISIENIPNFSLCCSQLVKISASL